MNSVLFKKCLTSLDHSIRSAIKYLLLHFIVLRLVNLNGERIKGSGYRTELLGWCWLLIETECENLPPA